MYSLDAMYEENSAYKDLRSKEIGRWASLYRILKIGGILEEVIAYLACIRIGHKEPSEEFIKKYSAHLRYYLNHPEIHYKYKITKENYVKDILESIRPKYDKLLSILKRNGNVKIEEKEEVKDIVSFFANNDKNFDIRAVILKDFFSSEEGSKLSEMSKIEMALKVGALDASSIKYYGEDGNLIK